MALREVLAKFGIDISGQEQLDRVDRSINKAKTSAEKLEEGLKTLGTVWAAKRIIEKFKAFVEETVRSADALKHNAERLGVSTEELQAYQYAADLTGVSAEQTAVGIRFFNRAVGEAALGTKSATKVFGQLGINIRDSGGELKPTDQLLFEFADKLKNTQSQALRTAYATRLLGRNGSALLPMLQQGGKALQEMFKDVQELGGGFNKDFVEGAHKVDIQMKRLQMGYRSVKVAIATELLPVLERMARNSIRQVKLFIDMSKHTYGIRTALMVLAATAAFLSGIWLAMNPQLLGLVLLFGVLAAAIGVVYLVVDDLYTSFKGGDSFFSDFIDRINGKGASAAFWQQMVGVFDEVRQAIFGADNSGKSLFDTILGGIINAIPFIVKWGGTIMTAIVGAVDAAITAFRELFALIGGVVAAATGGFSNIGKNLKQGLSNAGDIQSGFEKRMGTYQNVVGAFQNLDKPGVYDKNMALDNQGNFNANRMKGYQGEKTAGWAPTTAPPGAEGGTGTRIENHIVIHGASDPQQTARLVKGAATQGTKSALSQHRDTYAAVTMGQPQIANP